MRSCSVIFLWTLLLVSCSSTTGRDFSYGSDKIFQDPYFGWIRGRQVGLITNQTGVTSDLRPLSRQLESHEEVRLTALFGPEHGISGAAQAGEAVASGPRIYSLYGETRSPTPSMLEDVEVLLYDIQDVGARFYTFISTMRESMLAAEEKNIPFLVLDRPVPIDGTRVAGPVLSKGYESFVGIRGLPIRYAMTPGELARFLRAEFQMELVLEVVPMSGWSRQEWFDDLDVQWVPPSPNMPTVTTASLYPGTCLIEGTNLSEGRGTTRPFEWVGAPWLDASALAAFLNHRKLPGVHFRVQSFTPTFSKYAGETCSGVQIHVLDRETFDPIRTVLYLITETLSLHPDRFEFRGSSFDRLVGNRWIRRMLNESAAVETIISLWQSDLEAFNEKREKHLIY